MSSITNSILHRRPNFIHRFPRLWKLWSHLAWPFSRNVCSSFWRRDNFLTTVGGGSGGSGGGGGGGDSSGGVGVGVDVGVEVPGRSVSMGIRSGTGLLLWFTSAAAASTANVASGGLCSSGKNLKLPPASMDSTCSQATANQTQRNTEKHPYKLVQANQLPKIKPGTIWSNMVKPGKNRKWKAFMSTVDSITDLLQETRIILNNVE